MILMALLVSTLLWADLHNRYVWVLIAGHRGLWRDRLPRRLLEEAQAPEGHLGQLEVRRRRSSPVGAADGLALPVAARRLHHRRCPSPSSRAGWSPSAWLWVPFAVLVIVGASNAVNLTDGLDGLAIGPIVIGGRRLRDHRVPHRQLPGSREYLRILNVKGAGELAIFCGALVGAALGLPLVQHLSGAGLHGRRGLARAGRRARDARGADQVRAAAAAHRRASSWWRRCR